MTQQNAVDGAGWAGEAQLAPAELAACACPSPGNAGAVRRRAAPALARSSADCVADGDSARRWRPRRLRDSAPTKADRSDARCRTRDTGCSRTARGARPQPRIVPAALELPSSSKPSRFHSRRERAPAPKWKACLETTWKACHGTEQSETWDAHNPHHGCIVFPGCCSGGTAGCACGASKPGTCGACSILPLAASTMLMLYLSSVSATNSESAARSTA